MEEAMDNNLGIAEPVIDPKRISEICRLRTPERYDEMWKYVYEIKVSFIKILAKVEDHEWATQVAIAIEQGANDEELKNKYNFEEKYILAGKKYLEEHREEVLEVINKSKI
jgi:hypothetical protein